ncbi:glycosyltransferase [Halobacteriovorax sp. GB3]|uniref:glycosyltransferase n=1 Tax=Halobacteriovorax sp. GB3 TaxID=2719615 RepID=UPI002360E5A5|nr:glycosyltransferase [Halobacteriovorax sp. GB3]MDD0852543.1 glycosyltransferase [Halobacteriovorax sp. GB3]
MNILFVTEDSFQNENLNGVTKINYNLIKHFNDHDVFNLFLYSNSEVKKSNAYGCGVTNRGKSKLRSLLSSRPFMFLSDENAKLLASKIIELEHSFDVIHLSAFGLSPVADYLDDRIRQKIFFSAIDSLSLFFNRRFKVETNLIKKGLYFLESKKAELAEKKYFKKFKINHFVSDTDLNHVQAWCKDGIFIQNGVDIDYFSFNHNPIDKKTITFTGNMNYGPNVDAVLHFSREILPKLWKQIPDLTFYVVGNKPSEEIKSLSKKDNRIVVTGFVEDIREYLKKTSLYISPLRLGAGIKNKVLEAMAIGTPIIASSLSLEGIKTDQIEVADTDDQWVEKIHNFFNSNEDSRVRTLASRDLIVKEYSWEFVANEYLKEYQKLL